MLPPLHRNVLVGAVLSTAALGGFATVAPRSTPTPERHDNDFRSTARDRQSVSLTVYNQNFGLVREVRDVAFTQGIASLEYQDVAQHVQPEAVYIRALDGGLRILEQNYQYDLLNPEKLLEKYVGQTVKVYRYDSRTQREEPVNAEVLSVNGRPILKVDGEITFDFHGRFSFPDIPENLIARPTLVWMLESARPRHRLEVSYLTNNMNWKADYVLVVDANDARGDLTGWVTLSNQSGATYENAQLKLVAGEVQRLAPVNERLAMKADAISGLARGERPQFTEQGFFEYHLYTLDRPTTLRENEQKQVTLLEAAGIGLEKRLIFYGAAQYYRGAYGAIVSNQKVGVYLDLQNSERNHLGIPLPKGIVRVYKADKSGAQQFIGEDRIEHTPRDERVRIHMGEAFDVVGDRRQTEYRVISSCISESAWDISLRNHKDERVEVDVIEPLGGDWEVLSSSREYRKVDAHTLSYRVPVAARGEGKVSYRIRVRWC